MVQKQISIRKELVKAKAVSPKPGYLYYVSKEGSIYRMKSMNRKLTH